MTSLRVVSRQGGSSRLMMLLLCGASLVVGLLLAEGMLRLAGYGAAVQYDYMPKMGWMYRPNQRARTIGGWDVRINSAGIRGPEYADTKGPGVIRILLVGDSFTFGYGVAEDSTYGAQLERLLRGEGRPCESLQVINGGVNGYNTEQAVALVRAIGLRYRPDVVVVGFNPNDIMEPAEGRTMLNRPVLKRALGRSALYQFLTPRIKSLVFHRAGAVYDSTITKFIAGDPSVTDRAQRVSNAIESLQAAGKAHSFKLVVAVFPFADQVYGPLTGKWPPSIFRDLHARTGIPVLDLLPAFRAAAQKRKDLFLDEPTRHPNPQGLHVVALELYRFLNQSGHLPECGHNMAELTHGASPR